MYPIDRVLDNLTKEVEIYGRSGGDSIFLTNTSIVIDGGDFEVPLNCDLDGAIVDFDWFLRCSNKGRQEPHPNPDKSFWIKVWGEDAAPYGSNWNFLALRDNLRKPECWRRGMLYNPLNSYNPPCILNYHFQHADHHKLDLTVSMRSSDVAKVLPQDIMMTWLLLKHVCEMVSYDRGSMTFNIANAHVYYEDCEWQEEFTIDGLD